MTIQINQMFARNTEISGAVKLKRLESAPWTEYSFTVVALTVPFEKTSKVCRKLAKVWICRQLLLKFTNGVLRVARFGVLWCHTIGVAAKWPNEKS
jgi:hypothetical protein